MSIVDICDINPPEIPKPIQDNVAELPDLLDVRPENRYDEKVFEERLQIDKSKEKNTNIEEAKKKWSEDEVESFKLGHYEFDQEYKLYLENLSKNKKVDKICKTSFLKKYLPSKTAHELNEYFYMFYQPAKRKDPLTVSPKRHVIKRRRNHSSTSSGSISKYLKKK